MTEAHNVILPGYAEHEAVPYQGLRLHADGLDVRQLLVCEPLAADAPHSIHDQAHGISVQPLLAVQKMFAAGLDLKNCTLRISN